MFQKRTHTICFKKNRVKSYGDPIFWGWCFSSFLVSFVPVWCSTHCNVMKGMRWIGSFQPGNSWKLTYMTLLGLISENWPERFDNKTCNGEVLNFAIPGWDHPLKSANGVNHPWKKWDFPRHPCFAYPKPPGPTVYGSEFLSFWWWVWGCLGYAVIRGMLGFP